MPEMCAKCKEQLITSLAAVFQKEEFAELREILIAALIPESGAEEEIPNVTCIAANDTSPRSEPLPPKTAERLLRVLERHEGRRVDRAS